MSYKSPKHASFQLQGYKEQHVAIVATEQNGCIECNQISIYCCQTERESSPLQSQHMPGSVWHVGIISFIFILMFIKKSSGK
jgi:hypothetical protein